MAFCSFNSFNRVSNTRKKTTTGLFFSSFAPTTYGATGLSTTGYRIYTFTGSSTYTINYTTNNSLTPTPIYIYCV